MSFSYELCKTFIRLFCSILLNGLFPVLLMIWLEGFGLNRVGKTREMRVDEKRKCHHPGQDQTSSGTFCQIHDGPGHIICREREPGRSLETPLGLVSTDMGLKFCCSTPGVNCRNLHAQGRSFST